MFKVYHDTKRDASENHPKNRVFLRCNFENLSRKNTEEAMVFREFPGNLSTQQWIIALARPEKDPIILPSLFPGGFMAEKPTPRERFRYWFDNRFSGGPLVLIG
jgi:hypothetical protein